ncbi:MAG: hypothetical protein ABR564_03240, partial [Candidatus Dormibacteria bacterium]
MREETAPRGESPQQEIERLSAALSYAEHQLVRREGRCRQLEQELRAVAHRPAPLLSARLHDRVRRALPEGTRRRAFATTAARAVLSRRRSADTVNRGRTARPAESGEAEWPDPGQYRQWLSRHDPGQEELSALRMESENWSHRPLVSLLMSVSDHGGPAPGVIRAVLSQSYEHWELCLGACAAGSAGADLSLPDAAALDPRIRLAGDNGHGDVGA